MNGGNLKIFTGTANPALARKICEHIEVPLSEATVTRFPDGETFVKINENIRGSDVFIIQPTCSPANEHLMELMIWIDCLKRASARRVTAVIPYRWETWLVFNLGFVPARWTVLDGPGWQGLISPFSHQFLHAGPGYGGSCFPKDVKALIQTMHEHRVDAGILEAVEEVNASQKHLILDVIVDRYGEDLSGRTFGIWGLSFKPGTDDMREATSLVVVEGLLERGARVQAHDPEAMDNARRWFGDRVLFTQTNYDALNGADALVILTEWQPYRRPDLDRVRGLLSKPVIFDGRNLFSPEKMRDRGFQYWSVGRPGSVEAAVEIPA